MPVFSLPVYVEEARTGSHCVWLSADNVRCGTTGWLVFWLCHWNINLFGNFALI